jgi:spermidine synthase
MAGRRRWLFGVPVLAAALFALAVPATPAGLVADGRVSKAWDEATQYSRFVAEGRNASVAVTTVPSGLTALHISGKVVASTAARDMRIQRILGHLPAFLHRAPRNALVVGLGAGVTAGSLTLHESIERVVVVELEEAVRIAAGRFFAVANNNVVNSYKAEILIDDARHYMASGEEKFDVITSDPIHPWVKGAAALFSREYYLACRHRLRPGGVIAQWLPLYELDERSVRMALATFFSVFPNGSLWTNEVGSDQDLVMVGWHSDPVVDVQRLRAAMITPPLVRASMAEVGYGTATQLLRAYVGSLPGVEPWLRGAELNADYSLKLEYAAGLSMHQGTRHGIGKRLATRSYPEHLLANVPPWMELNLRRAFGDTDIVASETLAAREVLVSYQGAVPVGPPVQRTRDEALARASELAAQLREAPDSFEQVAKSASDATASASQGGRLPTWKTGAMPAAIELAVQRLAVGEIGAPVESEFGFHVLMREALSEQPEEVGAGIRLERVGP